MITNNKKNDKDYINPIDLCKRLNTVSVFFFL